MRTFTDMERIYLEEILRRNIRENFENQTKSLETPMSVEERKLRSQIRKKCKIYMYELVLAQLCGVIPNKEMKKIM